MLPGETQKITPFLWFNGNAEDAVDFYLSVFPNASKSPGLPGPGGKPMTVSFELEGLQFTALNGGPQFRFTEAISFVVRCQRPGRNRLLLGRTDRRWRFRRPVRLAEGQVRPLMADYSGEPP